MITSIQIATQNRDELMRSAILAKAALRMTDGTIRFITVHEKSTSFEFYWIYKTKSKSVRAARRGWKAIGQNRLTLDSAFKFYTDFQTFVAYYANLHSATVLSVRVLKARCLAAVSIRPKHETISHDWNWSPALNSTDVNDYRYLKHKLDSRINGRTVDLSWTGRK